VELCVSNNKQSLYYTLKTLHSLYETIVSGHNNHTNSEHGPTETERMLANFFAGTIIAMFRTLIGIFSLIFGILSSLAA